MSRIRVLSVTKSTGGLAQYNLRLCTHLDPERFEISSVCLSEDNAAYAEELRAHGIAAVTMDMERYNINLVYDIRLAGQLYHYLRRHRCDVVIGHGTKAGFLVRLVGRLAGTPAVYRLASMAFVPRIQGRSAHVYRQLERLAAGWHGHVVTVAAATRDELLRQRIAPAEAVTVIHTGIDLTRFSRTRSREDACRALGLDPARPVIGWAGRLVTQKAPQDFLRAAQHIVAEVPEAQIYMAGDGPLADAVQRLIVDLDLAGHVIRAPWQTDVPAMLSAFDVYTLSSLWEGLPQSLLEALAMGCASVATAVDGSVEVIRNGIDGFLVPVGDDALMAERGIQLLKDTALREEIRLAARQRIVDHFTVEQMIAEWESLLLRIAGHEPSLST
jgi:L-malate glycosyltransferase